jgi:hypothetical protein
MRPASTPGANETSKTTKKDGGEASAKLNSLTQLKGDGVGPLANEAHDGRAHSGLSGDDGQHQPVDSAASAASLQPGRVGDLGAANATVSGNPPSPAEDYANTGQAATGPGLSEPDGSDDVGDVELDYPSVRTKRNPGDPLAHRSGVGLQQRSESDLEQPRGDGNYQRDGDRDIAIDTNPNPDTADQ